MKPIEDIVDDGGTGGGGRLLRTDLRGGLPGGINFVGGLELVSGIGIKGGGREGAKSNKVSSGETVGMSFLGRIRIV